MRRKKSPNALKKQKAFKKKKPTPEKRRLSSRELKTINTRLFIAVREGKLAKVEDLLREGADVNATERNMSTPLMIAAEKGYVAVARVLLEAGADVGAKNDSYKTAMFLAVQTRDNEKIDTLKMIELLMKHDAVL